MAKTEFLQIRISPEDRDRMRRLAESEHLDLSTWARRALLQAVERFESRPNAKLKVAEQPADAFTTRPKDGRRR
jgi:predicted transcriptional regulator